MPDQLRREQSHESCGQNNQDHKSDTPKLNITPIKRADFLLNALGGDFGLSFCAECFHLPNSLQCGCFQQVELCHRQHTVSRFLVTVTSVTSTFHAHET